MTSVAPIVEIRDAVFTYPKSTIPAVNKVSLTLYSGKITVVLGPNGSGKSTLLALIGGVLCADNGKLRVGGRDLTSISRKELARTVAVVHAHEEVSFAFSVAAIVAMGRTPHQGLLNFPSSQDQAYVERVMRDCQIAELASRSFSELSAGEQKRVAIARAFAQQTPVLLLDEPAAFLDIHHQIAILDLVKEKVRRQNLCAVMVLHDLNLAAQYGDDFLLMKSGHGIAQGQVSEVLTYQTIRDTFDAEVYVGINELNQRRYFVPMSKMPHPPG